MSRVYRYCGLNLASELALPELGPAAPDGVPDIEIRTARADIPATLGAARFRSPLFELGDDEALWRLPGVARYRISRLGRRIAVRAEARADPGAVRLLLLQPVFALAAALRGDYLLQASAVSIEGRVWAFAGPTASGKSTLAATLAARGHDLVADGLLRLSAGPGGSWLAHPQASWLTLWPDAGARFRPDDAGYPVRAGLAARRHVWPAEDEARPLARIALLHEQLGDDLDRFAPMPGGGRQGFEWLAGHTAGGTAIAAMPPSRRLGHFRWAVDIARAVPIERLDLPWGWERHEALAKALASWCGASADRSADAAGHGA